MRVWRISPTSLPSSSGLGGGAEGRDAECVVVVDGFRGRLPVPRALAVALLPGQPGHSETETAATSNAADGADGSQRGAAKKRGGGRREKQGSLQLPPLARGRSGANATVRVVAAARGEALRMWDLPLSKAGGFQLQ